MFPREFIFLFTFVLKAFCYTEFEITVPRDPVNGVYGEAAILPCTFLVDQSWDLRSTVITWQRGLNVVHSFYYSQNQLERQLVQYANRTMLFIQEIARGNASLRLDSLTLQDRGLYTCSISTNSGNQKKSFALNVAAMYSEPRVQFSILRNGISLLVTSDGGFPSPTVQWLMESTNITNKTQTWIQQNTQTGLWFVSSRINLTDVSNSTLIFVLHNIQTGQNIRREIQIYTDPDGKLRDYMHPKPFVLIPVTLFLLIVGLIFVCILNRKRNQSQCKHNATTRSMSEVENLNAKKILPI